MTHETCNICVGKHCQEVKEKGRVIRVIKTNSFPLDRSTPETSPIPINRCTIKQEHDRKVSEMEEVAKTQ